MPNRRVDAVARTVCAAAAFGSWLWHFGLMGSDFNADTAIPTAMALRPFTRTSLYYWGGNRTGMLIPIATRVLHVVLGVPAHATAQLLVYLVSALGLFLALGLLASWPVRVGLTLFFAWPSWAMAQSLCNPGYYLPASFMLAIAQVYAFRAAARAPTPLRIGWAAMLAGFVLWAADNAMVLFPAELWLVGAVLWRARGRGVVPFLTAALAGLAVPAAIIVAGKTAVASSDVWKLISPAQALTTVVHLAPQLGQLVPALGGVGVYLLILALFAWGATELWALRGGEIKDVTPLALLGTAPLLGLIGMSSSRHFEVNLRLPRYLCWPALVAVVGGCLVLDWLLARERSLRVARSVAWAAALALGLGAFLGRYPGPDPQVEAHWRHKAQLALDRGCGGVIGDHWDVYPLMGLTEGRLLVTGIPPAAGILNQSLMRDALQKPEVCRLRSQRIDPGPCQPTETYYDHKLRLIDEVDEKVDDELVQLCRFAPES